MTSVNAPSRRVLRSFRIPRGFTLVEMLVAMAITLILMAALARAFGFVGTRIRESRADTTLASALRDMTTRLSDELGQCTVNLEPSTLEQEQDQLGYFVYYEGPVTDATSSLFRAATDASGNVVLDDSKYGDFDDYIAFTAVANGNNWFTGKVPRYVLDRRTAEENGVAYSPPTPAIRAFDPVVIRSKYAEIIYFASPEYVNSSLPATPQYIDVDGDTDFNADGDASENGLPDRLRIHRRVLLIRPDLNVNAPPSLPANTVALPRLNNGSVNFMQADAWPTATTSTVSGAANTSDGWLYGMAGVHQQCDLSLRRVLNAQGLPTQFVAANSLADLSKPHNRFAHVRIPDSVLGGSGGSTVTSMPVLALGGPATILSAVTTASPARIGPPATPSAGPVVTPNAMSGFLRPEFVLGSDRTHIDLSGTLWGADRIGEDLLTNNVLGFDVQVYDPGASFFTTPTNGVVVGPGDAGYRGAITEAIAGLSSTPAVPIVREQGGYVDLAYPVLAGGSLRGWQPRRRDRRAGANSPIVATTGGFLITPFSGVARYAPANIARYNRTVNPANWVYQPSLYQSGRLVTVGNTIRLFQPTFDTFTGFYERDGFFQGSNVADSGTRWSTITTSTAIDLATDGLDNDRAFGPDDSGERETLPPFLARPESIRVTIRIENPATRQLRQASVVHRDEL